MNYIKRIVIISVVFLLGILSCKKKDTSSPNVTITANQLQVMPMQIATLGVSNLTLNSTTYTCTFNGQSITLSSFDGMLGFVIPAATPAGNYKLAGNIEGYDLNISYTVNAVPVISNPESYIATARTNFEYTKTYMDNLNVRLSNMPQSGNNAAWEATLLQYSHRLDSALNAASADDKKQFAMFIAANPDLFTPFDDIMSYFDTIYNAAKTTGNTAPESEWPGIRAEINKRINYAAVGAIFLTSGLYSGMPLIAFGGGATVAYNLFALNSYFLVTLNKSLVQTLDLQFMSAQKSTGGQTYQSGQQYTLAINSLYRNVDKDDIGSKNTIIAGIINTLSDFRKMWDKVMSLLPTKLTGEPYDVAQVAGYNNKTFAVSGEYLSIDNISNAKVKMTQDNSAGLKVTFSTTDTADQGFTYDVIYSFSGATAKTTFSGTVSGKIHIGDLKAGGKVFYVDSTGQHGYVCALSDGSATSTTWSNAISICTAYRGGGYTDWKLPTKNQLSLLYSNRTLLGGFSSGCTDFHDCTYWSSDANGATYIWALDFNSGVMYSNYTPASNAKTRAVRAF